MAYEFNGTSQFLSTASTPVVLEPFTIALWFNPDALGNRILACIGGTSPSRVVINTRGTNNKLAAQCINSSLSAGVAETNIPALNTWQHACGVFESSTSRSIFLDGANKATNTTSITLSTLNTIRIGNQTAVNAYADGKIADVGIWSIALTDAEVASLAKGMTCDKVRPGSLVFYAPLVRDLIDTKGGLTITNNNGATVAAHPRIYP